jgi:uncharacterized RDD family membrane protein YckC
MKCEKCERHLVGESVICSECGHDSSLRRAALGQSDEHSSFRAAPVHGEANLIRFPKSTQATSAVSDADGVPIWRDVLKERVRQFREQRPEVEASFAPGGDEPDNPIVQAALRRLSKPAGYPEVLSTSYSSAATAPLTHERREIGAEGPPTLRRETAGLVYPNPGTSESPLFRGNEFSQIGASKGVAKKTEPGSTASLQPLNPPQPASLWDRTLAGFFDFALIFLACIPLCSIHSITGLKFGQSAAYAVLGIAVWVTFIYQMWTMLVSGRTCGMAWRHLRVFDTETREAVFPQWRLFVRAICGPVSILLPPLNLAVIWASGNQAGLADLLSKTTLLQTHARVSSASPT